MPEFECISKYTIMCIGVFCRPMYDIVSEKVYNLLIDQLVYNNKYRAYYNYIRVYL